MLHGALGFEIDVEEESNSQNLILSKSILSHLFQFNQTPLLLTLLHHITSSSSSSSLSPKRGGYWSICVDLTIYNENEVVTNWMIQRSNQSNHLKFKPTINGWVRETKLIILSLIL